MYATLLAMLQSFDWCIGGYTVNLRAPLILAAARGVGNWCRVGQSYPVDDWSWRVGGANQTFAQPYLMGLTFK